MRIDSIDLYFVENRFHRPWRTAYGSDPGNGVLMTCLRSGDHEGWSESSPLPGPTYCYEYGEGIYNVASKFLAPMVLGKNFDTAEELLAAMSSIKGNPFAKAGIEIAWWTLKADMEGLPLHKLLCPESTVTAVDEGPGFGVADSLDDLIAEVGAALDSGAKRVKLKAMHGWDVNMVQAIRSTFPNGTFHIDCNSSYTIDEVDVFRKLDKFGLAMIEQPFSPMDILDHAKLQKMIDTPICLDESITDPFVVRQALEIGACGFVNIKPARVGGLAHSLEINRLCKQAGVGCWVGGMMESDVGKGICVELAAMDNMVYPSDITPETDNYPEPIGAHPLKYVAPWKLPVAQTPGTPIKPDMDKMLPKTRLHCSLKAEG